MFHSFHLYKISIKLCTKLNFVLSNELKDAIFFSLFNFIIFYEKNTLVTEVKRCDETEDKMFQNSIRSHIIIILFMLKERVCRGEENEVCRRFYASPIYTYE